MSLPHPIWLFLLVPLGLSLWRWRLPGRLLLALRALALVRLGQLAAAGHAQLPPVQGPTVLVTQPEKHRL